MNPDKCQPTLLKSLKNFLELLINVHHHLEENCLRLSGSFLIGGRYWRVETLQKSKFRG